MNKNVTMFLDRDGVINQKAPEHSYITQWKDFIFLPKVKEAIRKLNRYECTVLIVTNQRGVARGLITEKELELIHHKMRMELKEIGANIDSIYVCPHEVGTCSCRKPDIGLFLQAEKEYNVDKSHAYMIGDSVTDIDAGKKYGIKTVAINNSTSDATYHCNNLLEAVEWVLKEEQ